MMPMRRYAPARTAATTAAVAVALLLGVGFAVAAAAKPLDVPPEQLPRDLLDKLYAAEIPGYDPADLDKLHDAHALLEKYFATDSAEDRRTITKLLEQTRIPPATIGRMCRIHLGWGALPPGPAYVNERIGPHDVQYFLGVPANYDRAAAWPLVIRLANANAIYADPDKPPTPDDVVRLYTQWVADEMKLHPDALLVMPLLNLDELYGPSYKGMNTVVQAMHHVATRASVDPKRVYLTGHGMGGHATWNVALHYPTYFAAINPLAGAAGSDWQRVRLLNLRNTLPVIWADTTDKVIKSEQSTAIAAVLKTMKYDHVLELTKQFGHNPPPQVTEKCYQAMRARPRNLYPQQVNLRSTRPDPSFNRVDWLQVYQPLNAGPETAYRLRRGTGKIVVNQNAHTIQAALTTANKIEAKSDNVETLRLYLNDQMMDLSKPVTVVVNNKTRFEGMVTQSVDELLKDQLAIGRGWRYFTAALDVDLAPSSTRPSTTRPAATAPVATTTATHLFFTTDNGKTTFAAEAARRPPFDHDGKPAVRAHVYSCDAGKTTFVAYVSKFSPIAGENLVRRLTEQTWTPLSSPAAQAITTAKCPDNQPGKAPVEIFPK